MAQNLMIHTSLLSRKFGNFTAVQPMSLDIYQGQIVGFLGANGAGKTTAIRMLCGLLKPSSGKAEVAGCNISSQSELLKTRIGYMSQKFSLYDDLTVKENMLFYSGIYRVKKAAALQKAEELLHLMGISLNPGTITKSLPLGYKQRLSLVCALLHDPPVLFLDEPTSGVDPQARRAFWSMINLLAEAGKTIIVSTHFMDEAEYCHRVIVMATGKILVNDQPDLLRKEYGAANMQQLFIMLMEKANV